MYKIEGITLDRVYASVQNYSDPFLVDIRNTKDKDLSEIFGKDYVHIRQLSNKGITMVILKNEEKGLKRLRNIETRCREFLRELIILYNEEKHYNYIRSLI